MRESKQSHSTAGVIKQAEDAVHTAVLLEEGCSGDASHGAVSQRQTITHTSQKGRRDKQPHHQPLGESFSGFWGGTCDPFGTVFHSSLLVTTSSGHILIQFLLQFCQICMRTAPNGLVQLQHKERKHTLPRRGKASSHQ